MYEYRARVLRVVDGDTVDFRIDLGFSTFVEHRMRLLGIDTPELNSRDAAKRLLAQAAKEELVRLLPEGSMVTVRTEKDRTEKYGRYLAMVETDTVPDVAQHLIECGFGVAYEGGKR